MKDKDIKVPVVVVVVVFCVSSPSLKFMSLGFIDSNLLIQISPKLNKECRVLPHYCTCNKQTPYPLSSTCQFLKTTPLFSAATTQQTKFQSLKQQTAGFSAIMPKLLGELLQEQQEPFVLEAYLLERGYTHMIKNSTNGGWINSFMEKWNSRHTTATKYRLSTSSGTTKFNSSSSSDSNLEDRRCNEAEIRQSQSMKLGRAVMKEVFAAEKGKWGAVEDSKQLSPVSVLQDSESDEGSPIKQNTGKSNFKASQGESSASIASIFEHNSEQQQHCSVQGLPRLESSDSYSQYDTNKRAMKQTKQLLIDCAREVIEYHRERETGRQQMGTILGADDVWKLVCEREWEWSQEPIDETNTVHLLCHDFLDGEKRADSEKQIMEISIEIDEISIEIEDDIFGDVINEMLIC